MTVARRYRRGDELDRLARSSRDLHNILHELQELSCGFVSLGETGCDTTTAAGRLMLTIMGGIAAFERGLIQARCEEGIAKVREQGKKFGRPSALDAGQRRKIADRYAAGETIAELAKRTWPVLLPARPGHATDLTAILVAVTPNPNFAVHHVG